MAPSELGLFATPRQGVADVNEGAAVEDFLD